MSRGVRRGPWCRGRVIAIGDLGWLVWVRSGFRPGCGQIGEVDRDFA